MDRIPSADDFNSRRVTNPGQAEVIRQRFYDYGLYPAGGSAQLTFFSQPIGQGITTAIGAVVGSGKTNFDTNLELPNTLPSGKQFLIESIEVLFFPGSVSTANTYTPQQMGAFNAVASAANVQAFGGINDVTVFYQSGMLELNVLSKNYLRETPLIAFPPKTHFDFSGDLSSNAAATGVVGAALAKATGRPYYISPEITLQPAVNFEVLLRYPAAVPLPSTFNGRVGVILDGYFQRASQ
jgi:hypothetical protein